jgi:hypothetical protein
VEDEHRRVLRRRQLDVERAPRDERRADDVGLERQPPRRRAGTGTVSAAGAAKYYAAIQLYYGIGPAGADNTEYGAYWTCLAVYGTHGLTKQGTDSATSARGFYASDVVRNIVTRTAPNLTIGEIEATTFVIPQLAFTDPTTGASAIQAVNDYHGFDWGVYDGSFFYRSSDPAG